jgi:hypothetical protein
MLRWNAPSTRPAASWCDPKSAICSTATDSKLPDRDWLQWVAKSASDSDATLAFQATSLKICRYSAADASSSVIATLSMRTSENPASLSSNSSCEGDEIGTGQEQPCLVAEVIGIEPRLA